MELHIENYRGINGAVTIQLHDKITMFCGKVGANKTSSIEPLQALIADEKMPVQDLKQKDAKQLIHRGATSATATLKFDDKVNDIRWPSCKSNTQQKLASKYASGLSLPALIPPKDLSATLGILPTKEDLMLDLVFEGGELPIEQIWESIEKNGWDKTHEHAVNKRQELKREWSRLSGIPWAGDKEAGNWVPDHFVAQSLAELDQSLKSAEKIYEHSIKAQALGEKEKADLAALAEQEQELREKIKEENLALSGVSEEIAKTKALREAVPDILNDQKVYCCWSCLKLSVVKDGELVQAPEQANAEDIAAMKAKIVELNKKLKDLESDESRIRVLLRNLGDSWTRSQEAKAKLGRVILDSSPTLSIADARAEVELARQRINALKTKTECDEIYEAFGMNNFICSVLDPAGCRKTVLSRKLEAFNELLGIICENAEWPEIRVNEYLEFTFNGLNYPVLSKGQRFAVNCALQIALAKMDKSQILIFDGIDILDADLKNGLISLLADLPIRSVLGCTISRKEQAPNLADIGSVYWCENETVTKLEAVPA